MSSNTSPDPLIGSLKPDNAVELELIKHLKIGLDHIADDMQWESFNRSDVRSETHQKLGAEVPASDANSACTPLPAKKRAKKR
jgi:hypothetical protein